MSDERLKPCPFCGGEATFVGNTRTIKCKCCGGAFVCTNPLITALEVAAAWNTRKPMERIVERLEEKSMMVATSKEFWDNPQKGEYAMNVIPFQDAIEIIKMG